MLCGLISPTSGEIFIEGVPMRRDTLELKRIIGIVPQHVNLEWEMTVWENLELHGRLYGIPLKERRKRICELLEYFELTSKVNEVITTLSGGMQKKLMIARALMHDPKILILDEPTASLDPDIRRKLWDLRLCTKRD